MTVAYNKDPSPNKLNLGVGAYRTEVRICCFRFTILLVIKISRPLVCLVRNLLILWYFDMIGRETTCLERCQESRASAC